MKLYEFTYMASPQEDQSDVMLGILIECKKHLSKWAHNVCSIPFQLERKEDGSVPYRIELHTVDAITSKLY